MEEKIVNAEITGTKLGYEDHGIFTFTIDLKLSNPVAYISIGGYALDGYDTKLERTTFCAEGLEAIASILKVVGVDNWEDLKGKYIRVKSRGWGGTIDEIGNLMEDNWFNLKNYFAEVANKYKR